MRKACNPTYYFGLEPSNSEIVIHDLATLTSVRITNDTNPDESPSVSPDGNVVTWEHCNSSLSNCDIWQAAKVGAVWNVGVTNDSPNAEHYPDTNGTLVVYDSFRAGNADLFWRPVAGGAEVQLQMSTHEGNPSIAGNFIAFESSLTLGGTSDIFVYDLASNQLYQITNTPLVTEHRNDITVLGSGYVRVVWASNEDGNSSRNVKGATFSLQASDNEPPVFTPPVNIIVNATMPTGAVVNYTVQVTDNTGVTSLVCTPVSGSVFHWHNRGAMRGGRCCRQRSQRQLHREGQRCAGTDRGLGAARERHGAADAP
ncbi:TolB family protein [Methyloglobulus sp.]|uniref:TolB family protein n=1 Tax=Methyloglobulus sp. TaxID=2518622 RepID=UPI003988F97C